MRKSPSRLKRLAAIRAAERDLASALLTLKQHFKVVWVGESYTSLYYLTKLARKAP